MVAYRFEDKQWDTPKQALPEQAEPLGDLRFRQLFTAVDWTRLPLAVRKRFGRRVTIGEALIYRGHVEFNRVNGWGRTLTHILRVVGAPLPLDTQNDGAAAIVTVTEAPDGGQIWMRQYARQDTKHPFPQIIQSAKRFAGPTGIEEHIGRGIGMNLLPQVEGKELVFRDKDIFWDLKIFGKTLRLTLPRKLGPSLLRAGHEELGDGIFAFTLRLEHNWFGKMIDQRVWFQDDIG